MPIPYEKIVAEDLNLGEGEVSVTNPQGGTMTGHKINISTFECNTNRVLGRASAGKGPIEQLPCTALGRALLNGATPAEVRQTLDAASKDHTHDYAPTVHNHDGVYAPVSMGVTNGDAHNHVGGDGAQIDHGSLANRSHDHHPQYLTEARGDARYYTQTQLQTSGQAEVHWDNLTNVPPLIEVADICEAVLNRYKPVQDTWYTLLNITGRGYLDELVALCTRSTWTLNTGRYVQWRITVDDRTPVQHGGVVLSGVGCNLADICTQFNPNTGKGWSGYRIRCGGARFDASLKVQVRSTSSQADYLYAMAHYRLAA